MFPLKQIKQKQEKVKVKVKVKIKARPKKKEIKKEIKIKEVDEVQYNKRWNKLFYFFYILYFILE